MCSKYRHALSLCQFCIYKFRACNVMSKNGIDITIVFKLLYPFYCHQKKNAHVELDTINA